MKAIGTNLSNASFIGTHLYRNAQKHCGRYRCGTGRRHPSNRDTGDDDNDDEGNSNDSNDNSRNHRGGHRDESRE